MGTGRGSHCGVVAEAGGRREGCGGSVGDNILRLFFFAHESGMRKYRSLPQVNMLMWWGGKVRRLPRSA